MRLFFLLAVLGVSCGQAGKPPTPLNARTEAELRQVLGIPDSAERVIILSQSSHLDLDWLLTFDTYYDDYVEKIIRKALDLLDTSPKYFYSISEMGFLKEYWDRNPQDRERIRLHAKKGHLRIVGGGISSPDTLLPPGESLVRDWLQGIKWCMKELGVRPVSAWQPDSFGHSPSLPGILDGLGLRFVGFARVDEATAETLKTAKAIDFYWEGEDGKSVLAHWMIGFYCMGDGIDASSNLQLPGAHVSNRKEREQTNSRIAEYIEMLAPLSPTDYMFVPIGCDFAPPIEGLLDYVKAWNEDRYPSTGIWAVQATFEDHIRLVEFQKEKLQKLKLDMNPYWRGFYSTRPALKRLLKEASYRIAASEALFLIAELAEMEYPEAELRDAWWKIAFGNHHDFITGTGADDVYREEQLPMAIELNARAEQLLNRAAAHISENVDTSDLAGTPVIVFNTLGFERDDAVRVRLPAPSPEVASLRVMDSNEMEIPSQMTVRENNADLMFMANGVPPFGYSTYSVAPSEEPYPEYPSPLRLTMLMGGTPTTEISRADSIVVENGPVKAVFDYGSGWAITSLSFDGKEVSAGLINDIIYLEDTGGMWETELGSGPYLLLSSVPSTIEIIESGPVAIGLMVSTVHDSQTVTREYRFIADNPRIDISITAKAPQNTSILARFSTAATSGEWFMAVPYGFVTRPFHKALEPTIFPAEWADLSSASSGLAVSSAGGSGFMADGSGRLQHILLRNSKVDTPFGGPNSDPDEHTLLYSIVPHDGFSTAQKHRLLLANYSPMVAAPTSLHPGALPKVLFLASSSETSTFITSLKKSEDGTGIALRVLDSGQGKRITTIHSELPDIKRAVLTDLLEQPQLELERGGSGYELPLEARLSTVLFVR